MVRVSNIFAGIYRYFIICVIILLVDSIAANSVECSILNAFCLCLKKRNLGGCKLFFRLFKK